jgi:protein SMG6
MGVESKKKGWRSVAREWFARSVAVRLSAGEPYHHLGVLGRNPQDEELRAMYHSVRRCVLALSYGGAMSDR